MTLNRLDKKVAAVPTFYFNSISHIQFPKEGRRLGGATSALLKSQFAKGSPLYHTSVVPTSSLDDLQLEHFMTSIRSGFYLRNSASEAKPGTLGQNLHYHSTFKSMPNSLQCIPNADMHAMQ
jgi:hypothetical protein